MSNIDLTRLLQPIPGANPAGEDLRYSFFFDQIKEARREDDSLAQGAWKRERKVADYRAILKLTEQALTQKSKDLQIAVWLTEALLREQGYGGLRSGLDLCRGLIDGFWEHLYPVLEDGDAELRAAPLAWLNSKLDVAARKVPLVAHGHDWFSYKESRTLGYENASATPEQKKAREKVIAEGKLTAEAFDKAFAETPRAFYVGANKDLTDCLKSLDLLGKTCENRFGDGSPSFGKLAEAVAELQHTVQSLLQKKGDAPVEEQTQPERASAEPEVSAGPAPPSVAATLSTPATVDNFASAMHALRAGHQQQAIQLLTRDVSVQSCGRSRFLRKLELARVCVAAGKDAIAQPLLDDLATMIDTHKLDEWEEHDVVAAALVTILQSSKRVQADAKEKQKFFDRICRLDPSQALGC